MNLADALIKWQASANIPRSHFLSEFVGELSDEDNEQLLRLLERISYFKGAPITATQVLRLDFMELFCERLDKYFDEPEPETSFCDVCGLDYPKDEPCRLH